MKMKNYFRELLRKFEKIYYFHVKNATMYESVYKVKNLRIFIDTLFL